MNNKLRIYIIYHISLLSLFNAVAQERDSTIVVIEDGYIEKMSDKIALDISFNNSFEIFEVKTSDNRVVLYPNTPNNLRFTINYRFLTLSFQTSPDFLPGNGDEEEKGNTKSFNLGTSLIFKHWFGDIEYSKVKGYYLENTEDYFAFQNGDPYIQFPDLKYQGIVLRAGYKFNSQFSLRHLISQTERQLKSVGSFIPVFNFRYYTIDDQSSDINTQKSKNIETSIGPGYAYTFIVNDNFYASLGLYGSIGYQNTELTTRTDIGNINSTQDNFLLRWDTRAGIGYNGSKFYSGLFANISGTSYEQEHTTVSNFETRIFYHLFLGIRLNAPEFLQKEEKKLEKLINKERS